MIGILTIHIHFPGCASLKEKRGYLKPLLARLHRQFNVSAAEMGLQDKWQEAVIACGIIGNDTAFLQSALATVRKWVDANLPDGDVLDTKIELW
jgi:uncharacterized protein YlxP (DUF503 family)